MKGCRQVLLHHLCQLIGFTFEREHFALQFFVMLELNLEQLDHFDAWTGGSGNGNRGIFIGLVDFLDVA
jgi:hypothetical protein